MAGYTEGLRRIKTKRLVFAALFVLCLAAGTVAAVRMLSAQASYARARREYDALRQIAPLTALSPSAAEPSPSSGSGQAARGEGEPARALWEINGDYIGWVRVEGANIDYPVVRGADNRKYLSTSFSGRRNASGAVFMDSRCADGFEAPLATLYGHNMKDGSMFAGLSRYLDAGYLAQHPEVTVATRGNETLTYRIIAARVTDASDIAYTFMEKEQETVNAYLASLGEEAGRALALSTCTDSVDDGERLLVIAVARQAR